MSTAPVNAKDEIEGVGNVRFRGTSGHRITCDNLPLSKLILKSLSSPSGGSDVR
jgi:hypothetical protein